MNGRTIELIREMYDRIGYWFVVKNSKGAFMPALISHITVVPGKNRQEIMAVSSNGYELAVTPNTQLFESMIEAQKAADRLAEMKENERQNNNNLTTKRSVKS